ncbi:hypothetical protein LINPERHAP1_LOCUS14016 [Linum perenne]
MIENRVFYIEYESLENICMTCGFYRHRSATCNPTPTPEPISDTEKATTSPIASEAEGDASEWMVVQPKSQGRAKKEGQGPPKSVPSGSNAGAKSAVADSSTFTEKPKATTQQKSSDPATVQLAAQLADVLSKAACMQNDKVVEPSPRQPLVDVSNTTPTSRKPELDKSTRVIGAENTPELVNVPVVYDNPTFQGVGQSSIRTKVKKQVPKRDKAPTTIGRAGVTGKNDKKDGKQIRTFVKRTAVGSNASSRSQGTKAVPARENSVDKPPDDA